MIIYNIIRKNYFLELSKKSFNRINSFKNWFEISLLGAASLLKESRGKEEGKFKQNFTYIDIIKEKQIAQNKRSNILIILGLILLAFGFGCWFLGALTGSWN